MKLRVVLVVLALLLLPKSLTSVVIDGPVGLNRQPGQWAEFNCTVACTHSIDWYMEGHLGDVTETCTMSLQSGLMVCKEVVQECPEPISNTGYTERLRVKVSEQLAGSRIAVQCAGVALSFSTNNCPPALSYSRFALLRVSEIPTSPPTTLPSPTPAIPSPSPVICPSVVHVTASPQVVTSTKIVVVTVTPEPAPVMNRGQATGNRLSQVLMELLSWGLLLLAGFLVV